MLSGEEPEVVDEAVQEEKTEQMTSIKVADPSLVRRIMYLGTPFSRQIYRPLQFVLEGETLTGSIEKIEGASVLIGVGEDASQLVSVEMASIEEILWRGDPFAEE